MIRLMLDTNSVSYLMKKNHPKHRHLVQRLLKEKEDTVAISVITVSEIAEDIENLPNGDHKHALLQAWEYILSSLKVLEFNDEAAWLYSKIRSKLRKAGQDIGAMDTLIAAHTLSQKLVLITNNEKHFKRVPELELEQWM